MRKNRAWMLFLGILCLASACKTSYEKVRVSGNPDLILKTAFQYYDKKDYLKAQTLFDLVLNNLRGREESEKAYFYYAYSHYYLNQYVLGAYYFKTFSNTFVNSKFREEAAYMSAFCNYKLSPSYRLDQSSTQTAIEEFQLFVNLFPNSPRVEQSNRLIDELRRKLEEKAFAESMLYYDLRQYQSAVISFDNLLRDYPESPEVERVRYLIARADYLLSENSIVEKKEDRYTETIRRADEFLSKYPSSKYSKEIRDIRRDSERALNTVRKRLKQT